MGTWIWFIVGVLLIVIELFLPHFVVIFFGAAAILVAVLQWIGLLDSFTASLVVWFVLSVFFLLTLRRALKRWLPSESSFQTTDEDADAVGQLVEVVSAVGAETQGRIRFRGTSWPAICRERTLEPGEKAKLLYRDNLVWIVEPLHALKDNH